MAPQVRMKLGILCLVILGTLCHVSAGHGLDREKRGLDFGNLLKTTPPYIPEKIEKVTCVLENYESADCDWCPSKAPEELTVWKFEYFHLLYQNWTQCPVYRNKGNIGPCICHLCGVGDEVDSECAHRVDFLRNREYTFRIWTASRSSPVTVSDNFTVLFSPRIDPVLPNSGTNLSSWMTEWSISFLCVLWSNFNMLMA